MILEYLAKHRLATAAELSRSLGLTAADVRYHLKSLLASGAVERVPADVPAKRGRPAGEYRLAKGSRKNDLTYLSSVLLSQPAAGEEPSARMQALAARYLPAPADGGSVTSRLNLLIRQLNQHAYDARWEAHASGPRMVFAACPFAPILADHPELCQMDRRVIENWTKMTAEQQSRLNSETLSPPVCVFQLTAARRGTTAEEPVLPTDCQG